MPSFAMWLCHTFLVIVQWTRGNGSSPGRVEGSSRAMLATARLSCSDLVQ